MFLVSSFVRIYEVSSLISDTKLQSSWPIGLFFFISTWLLNWLRFNIYLAFWLVNYDIKIQSIFMSKWGITTWYLSLLLRLLGQLTFRVWYVCMYVCGRPKEPTLIKSRFSQFCLMLTSSLHPKIFEVLAYFMKISKNFIYVYQTWLT